MAGYDELKEDIRIDRTRDIVGENIKKYRDAKNMTQQQLADIIGVSNRAVSRWENKSTLPELENICMIASALGVDINDIMPQNICGLECDEFIKYYSSIPDDERKFLKSWINASPFVKKWVFPVWGLICLLVGMVLGVFLVAIYLKM